MFARWGPKHLGEQTGSLIVCGIAAKVLPNEEWLSNCKRSSIQLMLTFGALKDQKNFLPKLPTTPLDRSSF